MAAALPRMVGMVLRTGWETDRRALAGVVAAQLGQGVTAGWGLVAVNSVLTQLFADGPTGDKLREALPSLVVLAVAAVATAVLSAWSTAMSGRLEPRRGPPSLSSAGKHARQVYMSRTSSRREGSRRSR
ncbi:hypothetical protein [Streptomyces sp. NPDC006307]|uniref:hypothetical protein n=1 Tax=Streptomyces sp. NPDC006307 TaxID=3156748 RepID=UPI0033A4A36C